MAAIIASPPALILANLFLAAGPWMVRLADVGPVAAGFWRLALAVPFLAFVALAPAAGAARSRLGADRAIVALGGLFFAADLAAWHEGILRTKLANATLFGNFASFLFAIYGFVLLRRAAAAGPAPRLAARRRRHPAAARRQLRAVARPFRRRSARPARRPLLHLLPDRRGPGAADDEALAGAGHRHRRRRAAAARCSRSRSASR